VDASRIFIKLFLDPSSTVTARELVPVFHGWIQSRALDEVLIDVADYTHVHHGPGVVLICHGAHYGFDLQGGRPGLVYSRKREASGSWEERVAAGFRAVLEAARKLEEEPALSGKLRVSSREIVFTINDRLLAPNTRETLEAVLPGIRAVLARLFAGAPFEVTRTGDAEEALSVLVRTGADVRVGEMLKRLGAS
jgi:hypothetical protein